MSGFEPTDDQKMLIGAVQKYAEKDLREAAHEADEQGGFPDGIVHRGWELGILQASIPDSYGGFGDRSAVTGALAAEELAWGDVAGALAIMTPGSFALPILSAGTEDQKRRWLPGIVESDWRPYVAAVTEPHFDFYSGDLRTTAQRENGSYLLKGEKCMVPFADAAEAFLVFARFQDKTQAFIVPRGLEGLVIGEADRYLGFGALPMRRLRLDDVRLPAENRLGGEAGFDPQAGVGSGDTGGAAVGGGVGGGGPWAAPG